MAWVALVRKTIILAYAMLRCGQAHWDGAEEPDFMILSSMTACIPQAPTRAATAGVRGRIGPLTETRLKR